MVRGSSRNQEIEQGKVGLSKMKSKPLLDEGAQVIALARSSWPRQKTNCCRRAVLNNNKSSVGALEVINYTEQQLTAQKKTVG